VSQPQNPPEISSELLVEWFRRTFPGVSAARGSSLNGEVVSIDVWEFHLHGSLTTKDSADYKTGDLLITFWQKPKDSKPIKCRELRTRKLKELEGFLIGVRAWAMGVLHALDSAVSEPPEAAPPLLGPGLSDLLDPKGPLSDPRD